MKKILSCIFFFSFFSLSAFSDGRSADAARECALEYLQEKNGTLPSIELIQTGNEVAHYGAKALRTQAPYYIFNFQQNANSGFVIVSGDERTIPIIAYGEQAINENELPENVQSWLNYYETQLSSVSDENALRMRATTRSTSCPPLLGKMQWTQYAPYNSMCPLYTASSRSIVGCVATSLAMVMNYYEYPSVGKGSHSYYWEDGNKQIIKLSETFDKPYEWDLILDNYDIVSYTQAQADAVALLCYHCGIASEMEYTAKASGASPFNAMKGAIDNFSYNPHLHVCYRDYYTFEKWESMLFEELDAQRPVIYSGSQNSGSGHMFVIDGYDEQGFVHVNWGWGGLYDGYFVLSLLEPMAGSQLIYDQTMMRYFTPSVIGSQEYEVYMDSLSPLPVSVQLGEQFDYVLLDAYNYSYKTFNGHLVLGLFDESMNELARLTDFEVDTLNFFWGWSEFGEPICLPKNLSDGNYQIIVYMQPDNSSVKNYVRLYQNNTNHIKVQVRGNRATLTTPFMEDAYTTATFDDGAYYIYTTIEGTDYYLSVSDSLCLQAKQSQNQVWQITSYTSTSTGRLKDSAYMLINQATGKYLKNLGALSLQPDGDFTGHPIFTNSKGLHAIRMSNDTVIDEEILAEFYLSIDEKEETVSGSNTSQPIFRWNIVKAEDETNISSLVNDADVYLHNGCWYNPQHALLTVYDTGGCKLFSTCENVELSALPKGTYILSVKQSHKVYKFIK